MILSLVQWQLFLGKGIKVSKNFKHISVKYLPLMVENNLIQKWSMQYEATGTPLF